MTGSDDTARALVDRVPSESGFGQERGDEDLPARLLDDPIVLEHLGQMADLVKDAVDDLDQMAADLDDNRLAIANSVAWLVSNTARDLQEATTLLRSRLTFLAGQGMFPLIAEE